MNRAFLYSCITVACIVLVVAFWYRARNTEAPIAIATSPVSAAASTSTSGISVTNATDTTVSAEYQQTPGIQSVPSGYLQYTNAALHFALSYPPTLHKSTYNEAGGAFTTSFQDPSSGVGFEVYVTPYSDSQITETKFKMDEPSGVFNQPTNVVIDGIQATMFYGHNGIMGDTREVWFIKNGLLYEIATYKDLDQWLGTIMQTWRFL